MSAKQMMFGNKQDRTATNVHPAESSTGGLLEPKLEDDGKSGFFQTSKISSNSSSPTSSPTRIKEKLTPRPSMPEKRKSMRLSLPDEPKETNWLLMVFDPEVSNINEEEW